MENSKVKSFTDLIAWREAHNLVLMVYKTTDNFPIKETYGLTSQMRRSAISITSNIAEGFSRRSKREKSQFYYTSLGSTTELQNQMIAAKDLSYLNKDNFIRLYEQSIKVHKLINGLIKSAESFKIPNT